MQGLRIFSPLRAPSPPSRPSGGLHHETTEPLFEELGIEVHQQTDLNFSDLHVCQDLCLVEW